MALRNPSMELYGAKGMVEGRLLGAVYVIALAFLIVPFWLVQMPPLSDYPNHFARFYLLLHWQNEPELQRYYIVEWAVLPNLAADLIAVELGRLMSLEDAGRLLLSMSAALWLAGAALLNRALFGRYSLWPLLVLPFIYNMSMTMGLLSYYFASGLLLLGLALAVAVEDRRTPMRFAALTLTALALYISHLIALLIFAAILGLMEIERLVRSRSGLRDWSKSAGVLALAFLPSAALLLIFAPPTYVADANSSGRALIHWGGLIDRARLLRSAEFADLGTADTLLLATIVALGVVLVVGRAVRLDSRFRLVLAVLAVIALAMPVRIGQEAFLHYRLPALIACIAAAATQPRPQRFGRTAVAAIALLAVMTVARHAVLIDTWRQRDRDIAEFRQALHMLPTGARILPALAGSFPDGLFRPADAGLLAYLHLPELAVAARGAYSPLFFTMAGQQPVRVVPELAPLTPGTGGPAALNQLSETAAGAAPRYGHTYLDSWPDRFDYVIAVGRPVPERLAPLPDGPIARGRSFAIFAVTR